MVSSIIPTTNTSSAEGVQKALPHEAEQKVRMVVLPEFVQKFLSYDLPFHVRVMRHTVRYEYSEYSRNLERAIRCIWNYCFFSGQRAPVEFLPLMQPAMSLSISHFNHFCTVKNSNGQPAINAMSPYSYFPCEAPDTRLLQYQRLAKAMESLLEPGDKDVVEITRSLEGGRVERAIYHQHASVLSVQFESAALAKRVDVAFLRALSFREGFPNFHLFIRDRRNCIRAVVQGDIECDFAHGKFFRFFNSFQMIFSTVMERGREFIKVTDCDLPPDSTLQEVMDHVRWDRETPPEVIKIIRSFLSLSDYIRSPESTYIQQDYYIDLNDLPHEPICKLYNYLPMPNDRN